MSHDSGTSKSLTLTSLGQLTTQTGLVAMNFIIIILCCVTSLESMQ